MAEFIPLPPKAFSMINSMRAIGYSFETALADVIDNSISAGTDKVDIWYPASENEENYVAIVDNGKGMSSDELIEAMQYACRNSDSDRDSLDLGRFGLGLKTASMSQCRLLTVVSKKMDSPVSAASWDLDQIKDCDNWMLARLDQQEIEELPISCTEILEDQQQGTVVLWRNFDRLEQSETDVYRALGQKIEKARDHLSLVFHRFMRGEDGLPKVDFYVNGNQLLPKDPFCEHTQKTAVRQRPDYYDMPGIAGSRITVSGYTLPHQNKLNPIEEKTIGLEGRSLTDDQGFYIYRAGRLIYWGGWLGMDKRAQLTKLARVKVDIPNSMDSLWELDVKKSRASPPKQVREYLKQLLTTLQSTSQKTNKGRGKVLNSDHGQPLWTTKILNGNCFEVSVNEENPLLKELLSAAPPEIALAFKAYLHLLEVDYPSIWVNAMYNSDDKPKWRREDDKATLDEIQRTVIAFKKSLLKLGIELKGKNSEIEDCLFADNPDASQKITQKLIDAK